jgi:hypothetical protein
MMRKLLVIPLVSACSVGSVLSDTPLQITATTTAKGGEYQPANVVAVWIESADGTAIKTIQRWSGVRTPHLVAWRQKAGASDADAVSGATRANHTTPLTIKWSLRDRNQQIVPDGTYTIRMELADGNSTAAGDNNQGTFTFVKGMEPQTQTGLANGGFTNVSIEFAP